jgi:hypothetical protein
LLSLLLAHRFKIIFAGLRPDKIENELHFGHPLFVGDRMRGVLFQDVFVGSGKRFRPGKTRPPVSEYIEKRPQLSQSRGRQNNFRGLWGLNPEEKTD